MKVHNSIPLSKLATIPSLKTNISPLKIMGFQNKSPFSRGLFSGATWVFPEIGVPQNGWFVMETPIKMDDLGGKPTIFGNIHVSFRET